MVVLVGLVEVCEEIVDEVDMLICLWCFELFDVVGCWY